MDYATTLNIDQQGRIIIPAKVRKMMGVSLKQCIVTIPTVIARSENALHISLEKKQ